MAKNKFMTIGHHQPYYTKGQRSQSTHLQQPYLESDQNTVGQFLFDKENIEEKKELLFTKMENKTT